MVITRITTIAGRLMIALVISLGTFWFPPAAVKAQSVPVDLQLGGEGSTSWSLTNLKPSDTGVKNVTLHNAGTSKGFVTIWVSDVISDEGVNPESETGDTSEPGEMPANLFFGLTADNLSTNLALPVTINSLPQSATSASYIDLIPLGAGDTINLQWQWQLPASTGNDVQGDGISFTINYLLQEFSSTDVSTVVSDNGTFAEDVTIETESGTGSITIAENVTGLTDEGIPPDEIWFIEMDRDSGPASASTKTIGAHFDAGPDGIVFDQPIVITLSYDPGTIPDRVSEEDLVIAVWDENTGGWVELAGSTVDSNNNTISASISHFSRYTIIAPIPPPPPPPPSPDPEPPFEEPEVVPPPQGDKDKPEERPVLTVDMLGDENKIEISPDGTIGEAVAISDLSGRFTVELESGTRLTGIDGTALARIQLGITERSIILLDNTVQLSPVYEFTGYNPEGVITVINFDPSALVIIKYDTDKLPENVLPPYIARYTEEGGLEHLYPPDDTVIRLGSAYAVIAHASRFVVVAEVLPPPPQLPASFVVSSLTISPLEARQGQSVTISLTIVNQGETEGSLELYLKVDGIVRATEKTTLNPKSSETLTFELSNLSAGEHRVSIAGLTGQFNITSPPTLVSEVNVNWLLIDISVAMSLILGGVVLYFLTQRSQQRQLR